MEYTKQTCRYFIYRYVDNRTSKVLYIGKTKRDLRIRISEHESELKFRPYLPYADISYYELYSHAAMDVHEKYWIHTLQPSLNTVDRLACWEKQGMGFAIGSVGWRPFLSYVPSCTHRPGLMRAETESSPDYLAVLDREERLFYWEAFLESAFEQYVDDRLEIVSGDAVVLWDLDACPLPDIVQVVCRDGSRFCFGPYHRAVYLPFRGVYEVHVNLSWLLDQFHGSADYLREERLRLSSIRLSMEQRAV